MFVDPFPKDTISNYKRVASSSIVRNYKQIDIITALCLRLYAKSEVARYLLQCFPKQCS